MKSIATTLRSADSPEILFTTRIWRENGAYVAYTPELDVSSCGDSVKQARSHLKEAVTLFLEDAAQRGTLKDILIEAGFERHGRVYRVRTVVSTAKVRLTLPIAS